MNGKVELIMNIEIADGSSVKLKVRKGDCPV